MTRLKRLNVLAFLTIIATGCSPQGQLFRDEPLHSELTSIEREGIAVSYNLLFSESKNFSGYKLTLVLRNDTSQEQVLAPEILLRDASGLLIMPESYQAFASRAANLAGTAIPPPQSKNQLKITTILARSHLRPVIHPTTQDG